MISFSNFLIEYELTNGVVPSHTNEDDIEHSSFHKKELGNIDDHRVVHYKAKDKNNSHFTFVTDKNKNTVGSIEHKPTRQNRLAISNITKHKGASFGMGNVLHHLMKHGHTLESDNTNTENGAHKMLMGLAKRPEVKTHIENGDGKVIPHKGDITSTENQKKYAIRSSDPKFLEHGHDEHKHLLVMKHV